MSNYEDLKAQAKQKVILNDKGLPLVFEEYPLRYLDDLDIGSQHVPHPAFKINNKIVPKNLSAVVHCVSKRRQGV